MIDIVPTRALLALLGLVLVTADVRGVGSDDVVRPPERLTSQMLPDFLRRDLALAQRELDLDEAQLLIVRTLHLEYETAFTDAADEVAWALAELRPRPSGRAERRERRRELSLQLRTIRRQLAELRSQEGGIDAERLASIKQRADRVKDEITALRPPPPEGDELQLIKKRSAAIMNTWRERKAKLGSSFLEDLQVILADWQRPAWPGFERALRREKSLPRGKLAGEGVDLFVVLRGLGPDLRRDFALETTLSDYALDLDRALQARDEHLDKVSAPFTSATILGDVDVAVALLESELALRADVRDINDDYAERIADVLREDFEPEVADAFTAAFRARSDPRIYGRTRLQRTFAAARSLEGLDEQTIEAVAALEHEYRLRMDAVNARLIETTRAHEPVRETDRLRRRLARRAGDDRPMPPDPIRAAMDARYELEQGYRRRLEAQLTPDQRAQLPPSRAQLIERYDTNGDGRLDEEERAAGRKRDGG